MAAVCDRGGNSMAASLCERIAFAICPHLGSHLLNMKTSITCLLLALSLTAPALADTLKFPDDKPVASITFPEGWKASVTGDTLSASSEDGTVLIDIITANPTMFGPSNDKAFAMLKVKPEFDSWKDSKSTVNGMNVAVNKVDAKDEKGGTLKLTLSGVEVTRDKGLLVILRGPGEAKHQDEITAIMNSIAAAP
jgi:hypothetical protein